MRKLTGHRLIFQVVMLVVSVVFGYAAYVEVGLSAPVLPANGEGSWINGPMAALVICTMIGIAFLIVWLLFVGNNDEEETDEDLRWSVEGGAAVLTSLLLLISIQAYVHYVRGVTWESAAAIPTLALVLPPLACWTTITVLFWSRLERPPAQQQDAPISAPIRPRVVGERD